MTNVYLQGLTISLIGMGLTFLALGLLILAMILLERFFREEPPKTIPPEEIAVSAEAETEDEEIAVAIATALAYWQSVSQSGLGTTLEAGPSAWWMMGRARQYPAGALQKVRRN